MITNHDIEIAFVRAQNRINESLQKAQTQYVLPDLERVANAVEHQQRKGQPKTVNTNNPIANEEI